MNSKSASDRLCSIIDSVFPNAPMIGNLHIISFDEIIKSEDQDLNCDEKIINAFYEAFENDILKGYIDEFERRLEILSLKNVNNDVPISEMKTVFNEMADRAKKQVEMLKKEMEDGLKK
ncbi:hypothetical protein ACOME3_000948 [Neoechinorhynchus agilis]